MPTEQQILDEISRLQGNMFRTRLMIQAETMQPIGVISRQTQQPRPTPQPYFQSRRGGYYRGYTSTNTSTPRNVVIDGVTFQASGRSLVRRNETTDQSTVSSPTLAGSSTKTLISPTAAEPQSPTIFTSTPAANPSQVHTGTKPLSHDATATNTMIRTKKGTLVAASRLKTHHRSSPNTLAHPSHSFNSRRGASRGRGRGMTRGARSQRLQDSRYVNSP